MKVVVTGASGLLGRSLIRLLTLAAPSDDYEVIGLAYSRAEEPLRKLDLLDAEATTELLRELQPDVVVHCAAERFPDRADADPERARQHAQGPESVARQVMEAGRGGMPERGRLHAAAVPARHRPAHVHAGR